MKTRTMILCALFAALTAVGAFFKIPFALAAISLQFLFTAMAGVLLGAGYGALSQAVYVLIGLVGVPIFALGGGFSYIFQPTFGFLLGLIPCAFVIGKLAKRPLTFWRTALSMLAGLAVLYAIGVPYMALIANGYLGKGLTFWQVIRSGMLIYLPGDLLKITVGSLLCVAVTRRMPSMFALPQKRAYASFHVAIFCGKSQSCTKGAPHFAARPSSVQKAGAFWTAALWDDSRGLLVALLLGEDAAAVFLDIKAQLARPCLSVAEQRAKVLIVKLHAVCLARAVGDVTHQLMLLVGADEQRRGKRIEAALLCHARRLKKPHLIALDAASGDIVRDCPDKRTKPVIVAHQKRQADGLRIFL